VNGILKLSLVKALPLSGTRHNICRLTPQLTRMSSVTVGSRGRRSAHLINTTSLVASHRDQVRCFHFEAKPSIRTTRHAQYIKICFGGGCLRNRVPAFDGRHHFDQHSVATLQPGAFNEVAQTEVGRLSEIGDFFPPLIARSDQTQAAAGYPISAKIRTTPSSSQDVIPADVITRKPS